MKLNIFFDVKNTKPQLNKDFYNKIWLDNNLLSNLI